MARHDVKVLGESARWLIESHEYTNYTYDLTDLNLTHLAWFVSEVAGVPVAEARGYIEEIQADQALRQHIVAATDLSPRRRLADRTVRYGRRIGWYALVRALRPAHVVETGTDKGLGTCVLAAALLANGSGRLTTIDIASHSGYLISGHYGSVVDRVVAGSLDVLADLPADDVGLFIHDSWHTREYELAEFEAVAPHLGEGAVIISDNSHGTDALAHWAEVTGRHFTHFQERPEGHWYPGGGIGFAW